MEKCRAKSVVHVGNWFFRIHQRWAKRFIIFQNRYRNLPFAELAARRTNDWRAKGSWVMEKNVSVRFSKRWWALEVRNNRYPRNSNIPEGLDIDSMIVYSIHTCTVLCCVLSYYHSCGFTLANMCAQLHDQRDNIITGLGQSVFRNAERFWILFLSFRTSICMLTRSQSCVRFREIFSYLRQWKL